MKKTTILLLAFWGLVAVVVAWLLPFMARNTNSFNNFISYCVSFIQ